MTYPVGPAPDGAYVVGSVYGQDITEESAKAIMAGGAKVKWENAQNEHRDNVRNPLNFLGGRVDAHNTLIETQGRQITDLENYIGTGTTTPIWASTGGYDLVTFPDTQMNRVRYFDGSSYTLTEIPSFSQAKRTLDMAFMRGGRDTPTPLEVVRIITGADASIFDIDAWYVGIYVYDKPNNRMQLLWDSGNLINVMSGQRMRYHLATGMTQKAANDQLLAVASLQLAPGAVQKPRGIGCVFQTGVSEQAGTVPLARHAYLPNVGALPLTIGMNALTYDNTKIMWAALGASS